MLRQHPNRSQLDSSYFVIENIFKILIFGTKNDWESNYLAENKGHKGSKVGSGNNQSDFNWR